MTTDFRTSFLRDIKKVADFAMRDMIADAIETVEAAASVSDIPELKKLKGTRKGIYYRIKVDGYRLGITIEGDLVTFVVCRKRPVIYRSFP
jgi:mRNA interferase RelE/StbE